MTEKNSRSYLTKRYIVALTLIALLSIAAFVNMSYLISKQANDGKIINTSSHQLMLSQQIALYAIYYQTESLEKSIRDMENNHKFLLSLPMSEELRHIYFEELINLDNKTMRYIENAKKFRETTDGRSLTYILQNAGKLLHDLEYAANEYLIEATNRAAMLANFEVFICIATLVTLVLEALFIFRPANITINRTTEELLEEKNYSNTVIESSANAIISIDRHYNIKTYNQAAKTMFGFSKKEMRGVEDLLKITPGFYKAIHERGVKSMFLAIIPRLNGKTYHIKLLNSKNELFSCRISFSKAPEDNIIILNIEDITGEKLKDTLLHKQAKFAALGEMIAIIAHQWKQPLTELGLNNMYIKHKIGQKNITKEIHEEIDKNKDIIKFMSETVANFENFYKNSESVWFDSKQAVLQSVNIVEKILQLREIKLVAKFESKALLFGQQNSLSQVVLSVLQNSISKHNITSNNSKWIKIKTEYADGNILIDIEDNAGGIAEKPISAIFEPFHTGKKSSSTGLGLYMSKLVVEEKFSGSISASNTKSGALLSIILPVTQDNIQVAQHSL